MKQFTLDTLLKFARPQESGDEKKEEIEKISLFFLSAELVRRFVYASFRLAQSRVVLALPAIATCVVIVISLVLLHLGQLNRSGNIMLWFFLMIDTYSLWQCNSLYDNALLAIPLLLVMGSLILNRGSFILFTFASILGIGSIEYVRIFPFAKPTIATPIDYVDFIDLVLLLVMAALTVLLVTAGLHRYLSRSIEAEAESRNQADKLRKSIERYRSLFEGSNYGVMVLEEDKISDSNGTAVELLGYRDKESVIGHHIWDFSPKEQPDGSDSISKGTRLLHEVSNGEPQRFYWRYAKPDGSQFDAMISMSLVESGDWPTILFYFADVTEIRRGEILQNAVYRISQTADKSESFNELYAKVHGIIETVMPAGNFHIAVKNEENNELNFPYFSDALGASGVSEERQRGLTKYVIETGKSLLCDNSVMNQLVEQGKIRSIGKPFAIWIGVPLNVEGKTIGAMVVQHYTDPNAYGKRELNMLEYVSEQVANAIHRKRADEALRKSEQRLLKAQSMAHVGNWELNLLTQEYWGSEEALKMFGLPTSSPLVPYEIINEIPLPEYTLALNESTHRLLFGNFPIDLEFKIKRVNHKEPRHIHAMAEKVVDEAGRPVKVVGVVQDITEYKTLQAQFVQAQKMESIGILASGIAHDFNNILGVILGHAALIERTRDLSEETKRGARAIAKAGQRAESLVRQMLTFARKNDVSFTSVSLNDSVMEISQIVEETFQKTINIILSLDKELPLITADPTQIHQILLNLCVNAQDAMNGSGILTISTKSVDGKSLRQKFSKAGYERYAVVEVSDTGTGMDEDTMRHIFEPFFTTKGPGKGTGMGLAVVFGIVESHGGFIDVKSELGKGTRFSLYFPVRVTYSERLETVVATALSHQGRGEVIMVVEDEELLRELAIGIFSASGYRVLSANDGRDAVDKYRLHHQEIDLVFSDYGMPGYTGDDLLVFMKQANPDVKFILATGYLGPEQKSDILGKGAMEVITKPYNIDDLLEIVRRVLDR